MSQIVSLPTNNIIVTSCLTRFCVALRNNESELIHFSDGIEGMGEYLFDRCRSSFFDVYNAIVKKLKAATTKDEIEFLTNCLKWRIHANDHKYIVISGIIKLLKKGYHNNTGKNIIKEEWIGRIYFNTEFENKTLTHIIMETLEFIITS